MPRHGPSFLVIANITRKWYWKCHTKKRELTHLCHYTCRNRSVADKPVFLSRQKASLTNLSILPQKKIKTATTISDHTTPAQ
jgi:hypothetical protein